jgi:hypothetical protein
VFKVMPFSPWNINRRKGRGNTMTALPTPAETVVIDGTEVTFLIDNL